MAESFPRENEGTHRRKKVDEKSGVTFLLCDRPRLVRPTSLMSRMNGKKTHTHTLCLKSVMGDDAVVDRGKIKNPPEKTRGSLRTASRNSSRRQLVAVRIELYNITTITLGILFLGDPRGYGGDSEDEVAEPPPPGLNPGMERRAENALFGS